MASADRLKAILGQSYNEEPLTPLEQINLLLTITSWARPLLSHVTPWSFIEFAQEKWGDHFDGKYIERLSQVVQYDGNDFTAETKLLPLADYLMASDEKVSGAYAATSYFRKGLLLSRGGQLGVAIVESACSLPYDAAQRGLNPDEACQYVEQVPVRATLVLASEKDLAVWLQEDPGLHRQAIRSLESAADRYCSAASLRIKDLKHLSWRLSGVMLRLPGA